MSPEPERKQPTTANQLTERDDSERQIRRSLLLIRLNATRIATRRGRRSPLGQTPGRLTATEVSQVARLIGPSTPTQRTSGAAQRPVGGRSRR